MRCPSCGADTGPASRWCGSCGARLGGEASSGGDRAGVPSSPSAPTPSSSSPSPSSDDDDAPPLAVVGFGDGPAPRETPSPPDARDDGAAAREGRRRWAVGALILAVVAAGLVVPRVLQPSPDTRAALRGGASFDGTYDVNLGPTVGQQRWRRDRTESAYGQVSPATVASGRVVASSGDTVTAVDAATGEVSWRAELPDATVGPPVAVDGSVVVGTGDRLVALDVMSGERRWEERVFRAGGVLVAETLHDGNLVAAAGRGRLLSVPADGGPARWETDGEALAGEDFQRPVRILTRPVVWSGLVFLTVATPDGSGRVVALEAGTGTVAWRAAQAVRPDAAPLPGGSVVLAATPEGAVGIDVFSGEVRWARGIPDARTGTVDILRAGDGSVVVRTERAVARLEPFTGDLQTRQETPGELAAFAAVAGDVVTVERGGRVARRDPTSLEPRREVLADLVSPVALVAAGAVVIVSGEAGQLALLDLDADLDARWQLQLVGTDDCPVVGGGELVLLTVADRIHAFDADAGTVSWSFAPPARPLGTAAASEGRVAVVDERGVVHLLDATDGRPIATGAVGGRPLGTPVLDGDDVLVAGGPEHTIGGPARSGYVRRLDAETGASRWLVYGTGPMAFPPAAVDDLVVAADTSGTVEAFGRDSGSVRWTTAVGAALTAPPALAPSDEDRDGVVSRGVVVVADTDAGVRALDLATGGVLWRTTFGMPLTRQPAVADGTVVVRSSTRRLVALDARTGAPRWDVQIDAALTAPVSVAGRRVVVGTADGIEVRDLRTGELLRQVSLDHAVVAPPVLSPAGVLVCLATGSVVALR